MGLRERIVRLLDRGPDRSDPDEYVDFVQVRVADGPMLVTRLRAAEIDATGSDAFNQGTGALGDYRVMVRRRDLDAANRVHGPNAG